MMLRMVVLLFLAWLIAGCATKPQIVTVEHTQTVEVPLVTKCDPGPLPDKAPIATRDSLTAAENVQRRVELLLAQGTQDRQTIAELQAAIAGCSR